MLFALPGLAADLDDVRSELAADIQAAQRALSSAQASISSERGALAERINSAQSRVLELRERAVAARRMADEETLSLQQIENRIEAWRDQSQFQGRLLAGFLNRARQRTLEQTIAADLQSDLAAFSEFLRSRESLLYPDWEARRLVLADGQLAEGEVLQLGPVQWFLQGGQAGLARQEQDMTRVALAFDASARSGVEGLRNTGSGTLTFDPTLSRALLLAEDKETLLQHLQSGGIWVIPILLFALFATTIALFKGLSLYRLPNLVPALAEQLEHALKEGEAATGKLFQKLRGPQAELVSTAVAAHQSAEQRDDRLYALLLEQRNALERWLGAIAMTASVSPLLGLLGTVSGMITTFKLMTLFGAGDANAVSAGISEALVTTELGLVVAIPALLAHALMSRKVKSYFARLENDAVHLSQLPLAGG
ncbi:MAG TPA: MotA/TolQ/ExbB proton channel family protein [Pseudomonadaceae bacterium]|nr:MotA/TolQ/ExbB proton channel family protein [Pseudomonadaceae bacterium]